jgi:hypothetical protein
MSSSLQEEGTINIITNKIDMQKVSMALMALSKYFENKKMFASSDDFIRVAAHLGHVTKKAYTTKIPTVDSGSQYTSKIRNSFEEQVAANKALAELFKNATSQTISMSGPIAKAVYNYWSNLLQKKDMLLDQLNQDKLKGTGEYLAGTYQKAVTPEIASGYLSAIGYGVGSEFANNFAASKEDELYGLPKGTWNAAISAVTKEIGERFSTLPEEAKKSLIRNKIQMMDAYRNVIRGTKEIPEFLKGTRSLTPMGYPGTMTPEGYLREHPYYVGAPGYLTSGGRVQGLPEDVNITGQQLERTERGAYGVPHSTVPYQVLFDKALDLSTPEYNEFGLKALHVLFDEYKRLFWAHGGKEQNPEIINQYLMKAQRELGIYIDKILKYCVEALAANIYKIPFMQSQLAGYAGGSLIAGPAAYLGGNVLQNYPLTRGVGNLLTRPRP